MRSLLVLNSGSSSLKFAVFELSSPLRRLLSGKVERLNTAAARAEVQRGAGPACEVADVSNAEQLLGWLEGELHDQPLGGVAHRLVHGGPRFFQPTRLTAEVQSALRELESWDPQHLPGALTLVAAIARRWPELAQIGCFDTGFHAELPMVAQLLPIPRRYFESGVRRYGFHGLSYLSVTEQLRARLGELPERCVLAHLGSGVSMAAVLAGRCIDTTMAFTPNSGLPMGARSGDLDSGLLPFLAQRDGLPLAELTALLSEQSGLLGMSARSNDVRDLLAAGDSHAREALDVFCYSVKKQLGAYAAALGGLDLVAFSGGIGENVPDVRARSLGGLEQVLGLTLDQAQNQSNAEVISSPSSRVLVHVVRTDEETVIATQSLALLEPEP